IALLVGGFHLMYEDADTITDVIEQLESLGVASVCPTHCSGDLAIEMFAKSFKGRTLQGGIGRVVTL
ncbi:MAG: MBL fold hydrolase, partial [Campylobacteraceae bacterium 4484_4]